MIWIRENSVVGQFETVRATSLDTTSMPPASQTFLAPWKSGPLGPRFSSLSTMAFRPSGAIGAEAQTRILRRRGAESPLFHGTIQVFRPSRFTDF
jgi:hypothetical protein